jgi:hypothetical protein
MWSPENEEVEEAWRESRRRAGQEPRPLRLETLGDVRAIIEGARRVELARVAGAPGRVALVVWFVSGGGAIEKMAIVLKGAWVEALEQFVRKEQQGDGK